MKHAGYFRWLIRNFVEDDGNNATYRDGYIHLYDQLYHKAYYFLVANDENRASDGLYLRDRYCDYMDDDRADVPNGPCSFLEFLIGISIRLSEMLADAEVIPVSEYLWTLVDRLGLIDYSDEMYNDEATMFVVDEILVSYMDRRYDRCGRPGLFPLEPPCKDQRNIEVWYQLNDYLMQNPGFF